MLPRTLFEDHHEQFRDTVRRFVAREIAPHHAAWERDGVVSREVWRAAGEAGLLCCEVPEAYGGPGGDFLHGVVVIEELARAGASGPAFHLHSDIVAPYVLAYGSEDQKRTWLPRLARGEAIAAVGMTEPGAGSDLKALRTRAVRDGNHFVVNGQKVFISNGQLADLLVLACRTGGEGADGISLLLVEGDRSGFQRGRNLDKVGYRAQDTSELFFEDVRVPITNLLGEEGRGFAHLMAQLPQERLVVAVRSAESLVAACEWTLDHVRAREAFGRRIADFQNTRFELADMHAQAMAVRALVDRCVALHLEGALTAEDAAAAKLYSTEALGRVVDRGLQLHGGSGYLWDTPIARAWADARMSRIAGGTSEIMKEIVGRALVGPPPAPR